MTDQKDTSAGAVERYDVIERHLSTGLGAEMEENEYGEWVKYDDYAAREARDAEVRRKALEEAMDRITSDARNTLDGLSEYEAGIVCDKLRHLTEEGRGQ